MVALSPGDGSSGLRGTSDGGVLVGFPRGRLGQLLGAEKIGLIKKPEGAALADGEFCALHIHRVVDALEWLQPISSRSRWMN